MNRRQRKKLIAKGVAALSRDNTPRIRLSITPRELHLLLEGLDAHRYHELSDISYRDSGFVRDPGSDDPERAEAIKEVDQLESTLQLIQNLHGKPE